MRGVEERAITQSRGGGGYLLNMASDLGKTLVPVVFYSVTKEKDNALSRV